MRTSEVVLLALLLSTTALAYDGHRYTVEPITVTIGEVPAITERGASVPVTVTVSNSSDGAVDCELHIRMTDGWRTREPNILALTVPARGEATTELHLVCPPDAYSAHYPLHVTAVFEHAGQRSECHAVQVFEPKLPPLPQPAGQWRTLELVDGGTLHLSAAKSWQVRWQYFDGQWQNLPPNWQGTVPGARATVQLRASAVRGGVRRDCIQMHPPWTDGVGTVMTVFRVTLPPTPARLRFFTAIRDHSQSEPPSDGVLFRVWVDDGSGPRALFERFSDAKVWEPGEVDLSAWAGKTIELALESHPGPRRDTTCDSSFWGDAAIVSGQRPPLRTAEEELARSRSYPGPPAAVFGRDDERWELMVLGETPLDAPLLLGCGQRELLLLGFRLEVNDEPIAPGDANVRCRLLEHAERADQSLWVHELVSPEWRGTLTVRLTRTAEAAGFSFECSERITHLSLRPFSDSALRCYFGHGVVVQAPEGFRVYSGGHGLATRYFGCDFAGGISLVQACDPPPDWCEADPQERLYSLVTHENTTMWLVPSTRGCFDAVLKLGRLLPDRPSAGVGKLAGRFVFDVWGGGKYANIARDMERAARYGLTDAMLIVHNWQRWGYDYRLPDIWPPNPQYGTLEDMQAIGQVCREYGILWGPHDNYIDYYPDAEDFSYDHICFDAAGQPVKAWLNEGRGARSYKFRPDHIMPFVQRNLRLIKEGIAPTAYFIDVFASGRPVDYWDRTGNLIPRSEVRRHWGEAFAWIRDYLGDNAPQVSEAGGDYLIGWLDGADAQMLRLTATPTRHTIFLPCGDWERVPWFNAVWHDRFVLHGAGYTGRYQGGLSFTAHGIYSDDYMSTEVLCGNALMVQAGFGRYWAAKYWLLQPLMRSLALQTMTGHEFVGGDLHRQKVTWSNGAVVQVNRGETPWTVEGHELPQYGFLARSGEVSCALERRQGVRAAWCAAPGYLFVDARSVAPGNLFPIAVRVAEVNYLGDGRFRLQLQWQAQRPTEQEQRIFVHFCSERSQRGEAIAFQGDHTPDPPTTQWRGTVTTSVTVTVPEQFGAGEYPIRVGLYSDSRLPLLGPRDENNRVKVGTLVVEGEGANITGVRFVEPAEQDQEEAVEYNAARTVVDFGPVQTNGAMRLTLQGEALLVTPLPAEPEATVSLDLARLFAGRGPRSLARIVALDESGKEGDRVEFTQEGSRVTFRTRPGDFAYRLTAQ